MAISELIPVSHLNAYVYCPRRFFIEHNRGMFEDNTHTIEGRTGHHVVDAKGNEGKAVNKGDVIHRRSVQFSSPDLGIIGKLDLLEEKENELYPVEYKKGKKPKDRAPWQNDQVQLCAQALLMAENGLARPDRGFVYYIASKARAEVPITEPLIEETRRIIAECRLISMSDAPPPLAGNRNKCFGCSLNALCLPEEEDIMKGLKVNARSILPSVMDGDILYVDKIGAYIGLSGGTVRVTEPGGNEIGSVSLEKLREIDLFGPVQITTQAIHECLNRQIPIHYLNSYGRYIGSSLPALHLHGLLRKSQWEAHFDSHRSLELAKTVVLSKLTNMRTLMLRYLRDQRTAQDESNLDQFKRIKKNIENVDNTDSLRGYEGIASKIYFSEFERYIKEDKRSFFYFKERNKRPPKDPVNAILSFGYSLLAKDCTYTAARVGFDAYCGFYHTMKYGRPSLALDIMEFFRQPIVDSLAITVINNGVFKENDFYRFQNVCYLNEKGRKTFLVQYELRKKDLITHPKFHYRLSYNRTIELQFRLLGKYLLKEIDGYEGFYIR